MMFASLSHKIILYFCYHFPWKKSYHHESSHFRNHAHLVPYLTPILLAVKLLVIEITESFNLFFFKLALWGSLYQRNFSIIAFLSWNRLSYPMTSINVFFRNLNFQLFLQYVNNHIVSNFIFVFLYSVNQ